MEKNIVEKKIQKVNYFCISSSNSFKIMDNMHLAIVNDHFQKTLGLLEENAFGNFFQIFMNKIFPIKTNTDLYFQNIFLVDKYLLQSQTKEIKDISESMNYMLNYEYKGEFFLSKEMIEHVGNILLFGFCKIRNKFKLYLIKSYADFKEKLENVKFHQIDLLNEYYNPEFFNKKGKNKNKTVKKYIYFKDPFVDNDGKVLGKENKQLPNELILLINKLQFIKTISFQIESIFSDINNNTNASLEMIKYLIILINIQWLFPNILVVNFDLSNSNLSNALIDIMSWKLYLSNKSLNIFEKKNFYPSYDNSSINNDNFDLIIKQKNKKKKENIFSKEKYLYFEMDNSDDDEYQIIDNIDNKKKPRKEEIKDLYNEYINKYTQEFDLIIITTYFIRILDKLHALNLKCPDTFCAEIRESYKNIKNSKDINFLNFIIDIKQLNIINIEFNSIDFTIFEKILGIINSNINLSCLKLVLFSQDKFYSPGGLYKLLNDIDDPDLDLDLLDINSNIENSILNQFFLDKYQKNLEILGTLIKNRRKTLNELSLNLNIPICLINNDNYILSLIKFIINIFLFLCFEKNQIKIVKLIAPLIKLDNRKTIFLNELFGKIDNSNCDNIHTLFLQFNFCKMNNIVNLLNINLNTVNIGNLDLCTFSSFVEKYTSDEFISESKLVNVKIILNESIIEYNKDIKNNFLKLFQKNPKNLMNFEIITNIIINYEQLHELIIIIKQNFVNKYIITFNEKSKDISDEKIKGELLNVVSLNKDIEKKLKVITKLIISKMKKDKENKNKSLIRKKIFNNIKTLLFDKKDIKFEFN